MVARLKVKLSTSPISKCATYYKSNIWIAPIMALVMFVLYPTVESCHLYWRPSQSSCDVSTIKEKKRNSLLRPVTSLLKPVTVTSMMDFFILYCPSSLKLKSSRKLAGRCWIAADFNRNQVQIRSLKFIGIEYHIATYLEINTARKEDSISHEKTDKL